MTPRLEPITATVAEFRRLSGLGKTLVFEMIADGRLQSVSIGRRRLIVLDSYRRLIGSLEPATVRHEPASGDTSKDRLAA